MPNEPHPSRHTLRSPDLLRQIMEHPGRETAYSVRTLATAANCSIATIGYLRSGKRDTAQCKHAHAIAEALGVAAPVIFVPPLSKCSDAP